MADTSYSSLLHGGQFIIGTTLTTASNLAAADNTVFGVIHTGAFSYNVTCFGITISTTVSSSAAVVVTLYSYPSMAGSTNARTIGTLTIPSTAAADSCLVTFPTDNLRANPGERILAVLTEPSSSAGAGHIFIHGYPTVSYPTGKTGTYTKEVATASGSIIVV